jgi:hypothetical protein
MNNLTKNDLSTEAWREYDFSGRIYRIEKPKTLYTRLGGETHRVVDQMNVVHCLPAPGVNGCVLRWQGHNGTDGVTF